VVLWVAIGLLVVLPERQAWANDLEAKVKAAYIFNFTKFIDWPGDDTAPAGEPIRVCIVGSDPIRTILGELSNREVKGRPLKIVRIKDLSAIPPCHLLFISRSEVQQLPLILQRLQGTHVLTVSDIPQFGQRGGMISFFTEKERVKIEVNQRTIRQSGLKVSAKLLEIARVVQ
jgi:hypothetical protein